MQNCSLNFSQIYAEYNHELFYPLSLDLEGTTLKGMAPFQNKFSYVIFPAFNKKLLQNPRIADPEEILDDKNKLQVQIDVQSNSSKSIYIPKDSKEGVYVHYAWIYMWCFTLKEQDPAERIFRLNQLRQVIGKLQSEYRINLKVDLFVLLIEACFKFGTFKMTRVVYEVMQRYQIIPDNRIRLIHFEHNR